MAGTNRGSVMPALANLMNPVEPDQRYTSESRNHHNRQQDYSPPQSHSSSNYHSNNYQPQLSSINPNREHHTPPLFRDTRPPFVSDPTRPHFLQLAPLSTLTASLPPHNTHHASSLASYQTNSRGFGNNQHYHSSESYSPLTPAASTRGSVSGGYGQEGHGSHNGSMGPPLFHNTSNSGWKDPVSISSSSSTTSSSKSTSASPQLNWPRQLTPKSTENVQGRSYNKSGDYMFPDDEKEQERLDLSHKIYLLLMKGALHWAPIGDRPQRILDIGTGTGIWVMDMAEQYPNSTIIGTDVLNIQPTTVMLMSDSFWLCLFQRVPRNVSFEMVDAESVWPWSEKFDFIHTRCIVGCVEDWPRLYAQAFHNLKPGGYIELQEYSTEVCSPDPNVSPRSSGSTIAYWAQLFNEAATISGRPPGSVVTKNIRRDLINAGFVDVREEILMLPLGTWHPRREMKELGGYGLLNMLDGAEGFTLKLFTKYLGWSEENCRSLIENVQKEFKRGVKFYTTQHIVWGRKPNVGEVVGSGYPSRSPPSVKVPYPENGQYYYQ